MLLSAGGALSATAGCLNRFRRTADRDEPTQVNVEITTLPDDEDPYVIRIANHLAEMLETAGIDVDVIPRRHETFLRQVLINQNYDIYVWRQPPQVDPDSLRPLLHSRFVEEPGWQNPFGFSNSMVDELLEEQLRQEGDNRAETLIELQDAIVTERPFIPIAFDKDHRLSRPGRIRVNEDVPAGNSAWLLSLRAGPDADEDEPTAVLGATDGRISQNLNPLAVEYRGGNGLVEMLYEPAERRWGSEFVPWLASRREWTSPTGARAPTIEIELRDDLTWHDDEPLTASDVAFSYEFLSNTTMSDDDPVVPAPRFREWTSIIDTTEAIDDVTVRVQFEHATRDVAQQALTLPILPEHIWENHTDLTEVAGITIADATTDALVIDNLDPVGSGPFEVTNVSGGEFVELSRFEDHFIWDEDVRQSEPFDGVVTDFRHLEIDIRPSASNIADSILGGGLDGTLNSLGRSYSEADDETVLNVSQTLQLFHVGFNVRRSPLTIHAFRDVIARLLDRTYLIETVFEDGADPVISPLFDDRFVPDHLQWTGPESATFLGEPGTGEVDEEIAREAFRDVGFQYSADGDLLAR